ncbi:MAG: hypothetical protein OEV49_01180 [candidate division Zixibacteria bacterium]|nr:hypothetical protein [candidate division Zixibacteria bacterium]MDH3937197.1 hypothetical protein [candidate division Zixibacteria bacterium]MDH4032460.1 hypothetical protein [candidate division Zixibacteria bacterium]
MPLTVDIGQHSSAFITEQRMADRTGLGLALISVVVAGLFFIGCKEDPTKSGGSGFHPRYKIETEPTRTLDGQYIYYIATDTLNLGNSGVFRAEIDKPIRELVLAGEDLHSPTLAPDNNRLAYLNGGIIEYYNLSTQAVDTSSIDREFSSIVYLNDTLLVGRANMSIYIVNEVRGTLINVGNGWHPSVVTQDTFTYTAPRHGLNDVVVKRDASLTVNDTLLTLPLESTWRTILWPGGDPSSDRWVWVRSSNNGLALHAVQLQPYVDRMLDSTMSEKALLLGPDKIIFTSFDGRFYETDWAGSDPFPWWYQEPND